MYTDIVGYTALTQSDEAQTLAVLERHNRLLRPIFPRFHGREVKAIGDSFLVEFDSALDATNCALEVQRLLHDYNISSRDEWKITLRIGVHLGDVVRSGSDILGDAVNIASRLQPLAEPEGVCISQQVYDQVRNKVPQALVKLEPHDLKGVRFQVDVYKVVMPWEQQSAAKEEIALPRDRIAILPFASFSSNPDDAFFADGMTEEVISTVSGISGLKVISRTSVMGYKGTTKKVEEIGRELKVGSVLEGSFRKAGNRIRVTTQLINVADDEHLWAQNYDRNLDDVFEVQSDIAKQVADALRVRILTREAERVEKRPTKSTEAYTSYLRGVYLYGRWVYSFGKEAGQRPEEAVKEAAQCFEQAVREDPRFALAYVRLARCSVKLIEFGIEIGANIEKAKRMSAKALELDPGLADAHTINGWALKISYDFRGAEDEFKKAIQLNPSDADAHNGYSGILEMRRRWDEALEHYETAEGLDPLQPVFYWNHGWVYYERGDYHRALELFKRAVELGGSNSRASVAFAYGKMKMFEEMRREYEAWVELRKDSWPLAEKAAGAWMARLEDDKETFRGLLHELETHVGEENGMDAYAIASGYFYLGENDSGFEWLERSYSRREFGLPGITVDPALDGVRNDPRYLGLVKRLGLEETLNRN
jgi:TolB-like protein